MIIPVKKLKEILIRKPMELEYDMKDSQITAVYAAYRSEMEFDGKITSSFLDFLISKNIRDLPVISSPEFLKELRESQPDQYAVPNIKLHLQELLTRGTEYDQLNANSGKKRKIVVLQDYYLKEEKGGRRTKLIPYGGLMNQKARDALRRYPDTDPELEALDSEEGILVFIPDAKDFKLKVDLFALLAQFDFPILDSNTVESALKIYKEKSPKMVVIANLEADVRSKEFLLELEEYDPFVKRMNYNESPASNRENEKQRVRNYYYSDYQANLAREGDAEIREPVPDEMKTTILNGIRELETSFSREAYYERAFALKQLGRYFNIRVLANMMKNLKKEHINHS